MRRLAVAVALAALASTARAAESRRWGSFELGAGTYEPDIDSEFGGATGPYEAIFGTGTGWMFRAAASWSIFTRPGSLEVGLGSGYFQNTGKGLSIVPNPPNRDVLVPSGDDTKLKVIPTSLMLTYRLDFLEERYRIPLAPYARVALERYNWWVTDGSGSTVEKGATNGWSATGGVAFLLDIIDRQSAREFDLDSGVNHTYLFFEVRKSFIDDFGSSSSWDLSDEVVGYSGGLLVVF